jgi:hypothetical protein
MNEFPLAEVLAAIGISSSTVASIFLFGGHAIRAMRGLMGRVYGDLAKRLESLEDEVRGRPYGLHPRLRLVERSISNIRGQLGQDEPD